jgi:HAD superfamily hydrolase (TIGR02253 family)
MRFKAVIFDLDNTLIDFMKMKREATRAAAFAMIDAGLIADRDNLSERLFNYYLDFGIESDNAFSAFLTREFGSVDYRVLAAALNAYIEEKPKHLEPYPGVVETLAGLKALGLRLAVVTDGLRLKAWMRLVAAGLDRYFDVVVTYDDTGKKKPAREPFLKARESLNVESGECLMVGDWPERDVIGAKGAGMWTCWVKHGSHVQEGEADFVVEELCEVLKIVQFGKAG